jgi:tetratricopeptide (TPR) repeat protein
MGIDLEDKEKHEEALGCFNKVLMRNSKALAFETALSLYFKGSILEKLNKIDEMISCYLELIKLDLEEQDVETIVYVYERTLKQNVPKQMRFLSSDIPIQKTFRKEP